MQANGGNPVLLLIDSALRVLRGHDAPVRSCLHNSSDRPGQRTDRDWGILVIVVKVTDSCCGMRGRQRAAPTPVLVRPLPTRLQTSVCSSAKLRRKRPFHSRTVLSSLADARVRSSGLNATL